MKKILFVINSLGKGGGERVVANLAEEMSKGNEVTILTLKNEKFYSINNNIKYIVLSGKNKGNKIKRALNIRNQINQINQIIRELEKEVKFDLITVHLPYSHLLMSLSEYKDKCYYVVHTVYSKKFTKLKSLRKSMLKFIYNNKKIVSVSDGVASELKDYFKVEAKEYNVINNPIDLEEINKKANEYLEFNDKYLLFVGRLTKIKRVDILIKAYAEGTISEKYKLVILGEGEEKESLINICKEEKVFDNVLFVGWESNPYKWMKNAEILVSTSEYEAFPMNLIEALGCGTKVVSVDCDYGPREILKGELERFLVKSYDIKEINKVLNEAISVYPNKIKKVAQKYEIQTIVNRYLELCEGE